MEHYHNSAKRYERWKIITTQQNATNDGRLSQLSKTLRTMEDYHNSAKRWTEERRGPTNRHVR